MPTLPIVESTRVAVTTSYHGVEVTDHYQWLEDGSSETTTAWTRAQQQRTATYYDALPWRGALRTRVEQLLRGERTAYRSLTSGEGSTFFAVKEQTPRQQPFLVALASLDDLRTARVVVDPNAIDPSGETAIDWFVPSPDGERVAVSLSEHGTEDGSLHVVDVDSGELVDEPIPHVNLMGGSMAWRSDGSGFWYTRCADPGGFRQQVWSHDIGSEHDRLDVARGFADDVIAENFLSASADGRWLTDRVQRGDGGEWQVLVRSQDHEGAWWQLADIADKCIYAVVGTTAVYLLSRRDAPRGKVLRLALTDGAQIGDAQEIVPTSHLTIEDLVVTQRTLWVADMDGGPQQLRALDLDGGPLPAPDVPPVSSVSSYFARLSRLGRHRLAWSSESFTDPPTRRTALGCR